MSPRVRSQDVSRDAQNSSQADAPPRDTTWTTFALALAGGVLLWLAFPPVFWWPLAWVAPVFWLVLIRNERLPGRRPYLAIGVASFLLWLALLYGIPLAHPALYLGWVAMSAYLAIYPVLFIALARVAVQRLRIPLILAAPTVWVGLELARGHAITGFSMALLGHTQISWNALLQIADVFGAYGVSFVVVCVAACLTSVLPDAWPHASATRRTWSLGPLVPLAFVLGSTLLYGVYRQREVAAGDASVRPLRVALIQGSFDTVFAYNPERDAQVLRRYYELSERAVAEHPDMDLIVWPEGVFTGGQGDILIDREPMPPENGGGASAEYRRAVEAAAEDFRSKTRGIAQKLNRLAAGPEKDPAAGRIHLLVGTDTAHVGSEPLRRYNSALFIDPDGDVVGRYYKMHRVMFGEYIPWGDVFPWLYRLTPMTGGLAAGTEPQVFELAGVRMAPSICFESTVPHLIRRQIAELRGMGTPPDMLINVTNDGWFWGSSILDFHLACGVFRVIENRLPMLIAANTGISAYIDTNGQFVARGPRRDEAVLFCEISRRRPKSVYQTLGDVPAGSCFLFCTILGVVALSKKTRPQE